MTKAKHKRLGKWVFSVHGPKGPINLSKWDTGLSIAYHLPKREGQSTMLRMLMVGIGWDEDEPLRPWPALRHHVKTTKDFHKDWTTFAWCGLFVNVLDAGRA